MRLRTLKVENYRGIRNAHLDLRSPFIALVGPGDSTKTTILDALGLVLSPRYNISFTDADFHNADVGQAIRIEAVVVDLPDRLIEERSHGKNRSGIRNDNTLVHDPVEEDDVVECLIIRLTVGADLEPVWEVRRPGEEQGERMTASERALLGYFRIGDNAGYNLRWGRGSALTTLTDSKAGAAHAMVEAQRQAREAIRSLENTPLHEAATLAQEESRALGAAPFTDLRPGLDPSFGAGSTSLMLHEGNIPLSQYGLGSRRLLSLAIQENAMDNRSIVSIDEIESGLDPHRLANLVRHLRGKAADEQLQVIFTTHSPLVVEGLTYDQLFVVRSQAGVTTVTSVPGDLAEDDESTLQGLVRAAPSSLLAKKVLVGEGATEVGFLRAFIAGADAARLANGKPTSVISGTAISNGNGDTTAPKRARAFTNLGYRTFLVIDGDVTTNSAEVELAKGAGVAVLQWGNPRALEDVIFDEVPDSAVSKLLGSVITERGVESVADALGAQLNLALPKDDVAAWTGIAGDKFRAAVATTAKKKAWFKREDRGMVLGQVVWENRDAIGQGELFKGLQLMATFVYSDD